VATGVVDIRTVTCWYPIDKSLSSISLIQRNRDYRGGWSGGSDTSGMGFKWWRSVRRTGYCLTNRTASALVKILQPEEVVEEIKDSRGVWTPSHYCDDENCCVHCCSVLLQCTTTEKRRVLPLVVTNATRSRQRFVLCRMSLLTVSCR
jgi:hypothetical protein